jgi:capsid protein
VRLAVLTGELPARDFDADPAAYLGCSWLPPKFDYVDPMKDVQAEILAIDAGLKSRSQAISERGYDAEQVDAEIAADKARTDTLGLRVGAPVPDKENISDE